MRAQEFITEMAGKVHGGIRKVLKEKGYKYLGGGLDKQAWLEPSTGQVLLIFGYRKGYEKEFSPDQRMFIDWINYCNQNKNNPHLPRFSGFESFQFQGKNYIQARMEPLQELDKDEKDIVKRIDDVIYKPFNQAMIELAKLIGHKNTEDIINYLGGKKSAEKLMKTVYTVTRFGERLGFNMDLHGGNYMKRPDGTFVVNDPFIHWLNLD